MENLLWLFVCLFFMSTVIDTILSSTAVQAWQQSTREFRQKINSLTTYEAISETNTWFLYLFDALYDCEFWSMKRVKRSIVSTIIALLILILLIGPDRTAFNFTGPFDPWMIVFVTILVVGNFVADYISLQETRWILSKVSGAGVRKLFLFILLDLLLTTAVFLISWLIISFVSLNYVWNLLNTELAVETCCEGYWDALIEPSDGLPFFLSTYLTSFIWIMFVLFYLAVRTGRRGSRVVNFILQSFGESKRPARSVAGVLFLLLSLAYGAVTVVSNALF